MQQHAGTFSPVVYSSQSSCVLLWPSARTAPTPHKTITVLYRLAFWVLLMIGGGLVVPDNPGWKRWRLNCDQWTSDWRHQSGVLRTDRHGGNSWQRLRLWQAPEEVYTDPESHNAQCYRQIDGWTDDKMMMMIPIADVFNMHTVRQKWSTLERRCTIG